MEKNYNYKRQKLQLPEYGRHIQNMVNSLMEIEDRADRNRQALAVIAVMGNLNPLLRDTPDYTHKLWDHLFIISDFKLDIDSLYPYPTREELNAQPERLSYPQQHIRYKHYGKYVAQMIERIATEEKGERVDRTIDNIARFMRSKSYEFNQEHPNNEVIIKDIHNMSKNSLEFDIDSVTNIHSNYKTNQNNYKGAKNQKGQKGQKSAKNQKANNATQNNKRANEANPNNNNSSNWSGGQNRNGAKKKGYNRNSN